ncbi:helix-turn-helix transcriptional regulator [Streptacidiphilus sp. PAMC 29251]
MVLRAGALLGGGAEDLRAAEEAGLVRVEAGTRLVFRHPLLRAAVLQRAPLVQRLATHRALAEVLTDDRRRVWHLALAATGPDERLAAELERTAEHAARRGGHTGAAAAYERAARLSPAAADATRRHAYAAEAAAEGGELDRAAGLAEQALRRIAAEPGPADPLTLAQLLFVQGLTRFWHGDHQGALDLLLRTAELVTEPAPEHAARVLIQAFHAAWYLGEEPVGLVRNRLAALAPGPEEWAAPLVGYLVQVTGALLGQDGDGDAPGPAPVAEVAARARAAGAAVPVDLGTVCGAALILGDDTGTVRLAGELVAEARAGGAVGALPTLLFFLAEGELFTGLPGDALAHATESLRLAEDTGQRQWASQMHSFLAYLTAIGGDTAAARESAGNALAAGAAGRPWTQWALGLLDLGQGRAEECLSRLEPLVHGPQRHHVGALRAVPDLLEAAVRLRQPERAEAAFGYFRDWAGRSGQPWTAALVLRCEALLSADAGAERQFLAALKLHGEQHRPWDRARTELLYGEWLRRERRRTDARAPLRAALDAFEQLGAVPWAERARTELGATGTTAPSQGRPPGALALLTPQEAQIVRLAAQGLSNRDIAAQLFLSSRTVGYHLYKAYPKLGVASRGELAGLL